MHAVVHEFVLYFHFVKINKDTKKSHELREYIFKRNCNRIVPNEIDDQKYLNNHGGGGDDYGDNSNDSNELMITRIVKWQMDRE